MREGKGMLFTTLNQPGISHRILSLIEERFFKDGCLAQWLAHSMQFINTL